MIATDNFLPKTVMGRRLVEEQLKFEAGLEPQELDRKPCAIFCNVND
jgi:hypothetical protein